jgi:hypothetical protein
LIHMLQQWDNRYQAMLAGGDGGGDASLSGVVTSTPDASSSSAELLSLRDQLASQRTIANERLTRYVDTIQRLRAALQSFTSVTVTAATVTGTKDNDAGDDAASNNSHANDPLLLQRAIQHEVDLFDQQKQ